MNELKSKLIYSVKGPVFTVFTPFKEDYSVDFNALENYISFMYSRGARLFYVMPYNSRYSQLNNQEIGELNKFAIETTKQLSKDNTIFVGTPAKKIGTVSVNESTHEVKLNYDKS